MDIPYHKKTPNRQPWVTLQIYATNYGGILSSTFIGVGVLYLYLLGYLIRIHSDSYGLVCTGERALCIGCLQQIGNKD